MIHWRRSHAKPWAWTWCEKAADFKISTADLCFAVIGIHLEEEPLPAGAAFQMLPKSIPSHPRGVAKRLLKQPCSKTITPSSHPNEQGPPWLSAQQQLSKSPPSTELTNWQWELFFISALEGNSDVLAFMIHPHVDLKAYVNSCKVWHAQAITSIRCNAANELLLDIEQHALMLVLLKVLTTKGQSRLMPQSQIDKVNSYLSRYKPEFETKAREALGRVQLGGKDKDYVNAIETSAQAAHKLITLVNVWMILYPNGHKAVLASPNELSLALAAS